MRAYLCPIKHGVGKIVTYQISENFKIDFLLDTIKQLNKELLNDETMIHSDQGSHYTSPQFSNLLNKFQITQSMSRREKCTDNTQIESFFGHFKCEVAYEDCNNMKDLKVIVDDYMLYSNYERPQIHKQNMAPTKWNAIFCLCI